MSEQRPIGWLIAQHEGEQRTFAWYVDRARQGDMAAARRAAEWALQSVSPEATRQNGGRVAPEVLEYLRDVLQPVANGQPSDLINAALMRRPGRPVDDDHTARLWWACVEMHPMVVAGIDQLDAAEAVINPPGAPRAPQVGVDGGTLAKRYRSWSPAIEAFMKAQTDANPAE